MRTPLLLLLRNVTLGSWKMIEKSKMAANFNPNDLCVFSSAVSVKEFKEQVTVAIGSEDIERKRAGLDKAKLAAEMQISHDTLAELDEVCSASNLKCPAQPQEDDFLDISMCASLGIASPAAIAALSVGKKGFTPLQERNYLVLSEKLEETEKEGTNDEVIDGAEVVLSIALCQPVTLKRAQEFLCIGRQKLTELRDVIYCPADFIIPGEHSENPDFTTAANAKDICPSGFLFIEGVFYNDTRDELSRDYSKVIIDWVNKEERHKCARLGVYSTKKMEETRFEDLNIKLGYPYVYCHQGNCEHLVIFRDLRLLHADDPKCASNYPLKTFRHQPIRKRCSICEIYSARWLTRNDPLMSEEPSLFCEKCFKSLHYKDGQKLYEFKAYQYTGDHYW